MTNSTTCHPSWCDECNFDTNSAGELETINHAQLDDEGVDALETEICMSLRGVEDPINPLETYVRLWVTLRGTSADKDVYSGDESLMYLSIPEWRQFLKRGQFLDYLGASPAPPDTAPTWPPSWCGECYFYATSLGEIATISRTQLHSESVSALDGKITMHLVAVENTTGPLGTFVRLIIRSKLYGKELDLYLSRAEWRQVLRRGQFLDYLASGGAS